MKSFSQNLLFGICVTELWYLAQNLRYEIVLLLEPKNYKKSIFHTFSCVNDIFIERLISFSRLKKKDTLKIVQK